MLAAWIRMLLLCAVIAILESYSLQAQTTTSLGEKEIALLNEYQSVFQEKIFLRTQKAEKFYESFCSTLEAEESFEYAFDTLKGLGKVYAPRRNLRIYTWNVPVGIDDNMYFGVVQFYSKREDKYLIAKLNNYINSGTEKFQREWDPALYYSIVETKHAGQRYYTLLGFDFASPLSNKKVIDVIAIDEFDDLYFCNKLIVHDRQRLNRLEFEFNEKVIMSLMYNEDEKMIVFDHLSPAKPSLEGKPEFYGPDFTYDGLKWEKGVWVHYSNIDVTN